MRWASRIMKVLVVEDHAESAESLTLMLQLQGHEVRLVNDGLAAVKETAQFSPDAILMDFGLPDVNGLEATRLIRGLNLPKQPFIVATTAWSTPTVRVASEQAGIDVHLSKPLDYEALDRLLCAGADA
jgi:two-component system, chemotaxis family, CheB/CheR fusion protein